MINYSPIVVYPENRGNSRWIEQIELTPVPVRLKHPAKEAMLVDELRFFIRVVGSPSYFGRVDAIVGDEAQAQITLGQHPITKGFIPVAALGRGFDDQDPTTSGYQDPNYNYGRNPEGSFFVWRFPKPLYLPPDAEITVELRHPQLPPWGPNLGYLGHIDAMVSMAGRSLPRDLKLPAAVDVPYVTAFMGRYGDGNIPTYNHLESIPGDLANPFRYDLFVDRLTSVFCCGSFDGETAVFIDLLSPGQNQFWYTESVLVPIVSLRDTRGVFVARDPTPVGLMFPPPSRTWEVGGRLKPGEYLIAKMAQTSALQTYGDTRLWIALNGTINIPITDLGVRL